MIPPKQATFLNEGLHMIPPMETVTSVKLAASQVMVI